MMRGKSFKKERTHTGTLRTKVVFSRMEVSNDFYEEDVETTEKYTSWAEIYDFSQQDLENIKGRFSKNALALESIKSTAVSTMLTLKMRDPLSAYLPKNSDTAIIHDVRYRERKWEVIDVRPDFYNRKYLIVYIKEL